MTRVFALEMRYYDKKLKHIKTEEHNEVFGSGESLDDYLEENDFILYDSKHNNWRRDLGEQGEVIAQVIEKNIK